MALIDDYNNAHNEQFNQRVRVALLQYAHMVATEPTTTTNHTARVGLIDKIMAAEDQYAQLFSDVICAAYGCSGPADSDTNIVSYVGQAWTDFAGNI